jgi:hypothetical protein
MILFLVFLLLISFFIKNIVEPFSMPTLPPIELTSCIDENENNFIDNYINNEFSDNNYGMNLNSLNELYVFIFRNTFNIQTGEILFNNDKLFNSLFFLDNQDSDFNIIIENILRDVYDNYDNYDVFKFNIENIPLVNTIIYKNTDTTIYSIINNIKNTSSASSVLKNNLQIRLLLRLDSKKEFFNKFRNVYYNILNNECNDYKNLYS